MGSAMRHRRRHSTKQMTIATQSIPAQSSPGTRTALSVAGHQDGGEKYPTDGPKSLHARYNITVGTRKWDWRESWRNNTRNEEMPMAAFLVSVKYVGKTSTIIEGHKLYFSGNAESHEHGGGFLLHKDTVNAIMVCWPVSNQLFIQAYAPTTDYDDDNIKYFYKRVQKVIDQTPKKDTMVVQGSWNAKIGEDACKNWKGTCGQYYNLETNERGLRLLESLVTTIWRWWTHSENRNHLDGGHCTAQGENATIRLTT